MIPYSKFSISPLNEGREENELAEQMLFAVAQAHMWHVLTKSYAQHKAFEDFYEEFSEIADKIIEASIGNNGALSITNKSYTFSNVVDANSKIKELIGVLHIYHRKAEDFMQLGVVALLDEALALCDSLLYKINMLD